jgi:hypothetical protein
MSDEPNLDSYRWYPLDENTHVLEVWTEGDVQIDTRELAILTREYTSLTIGIVEGVAVKKLSLVEANPAISHQHELNGVKELKQIL